MSLTKFHIYYILDRQTRNCSQLYFQINFADTGPTRSPGTSRPNTSWGQRNQKMWTRSRSGGHTITLWWTSTTSAAWDSCTYKSLRSHHCTVAWQPTTSDPPSLLYRTKKTRRNITFPPDRRSTRTDPTGKKQFQPEYELYYRCWWKWMEGWGSSTGRCLTVPVLFSGSIVSQHPPRAHRQHAVGNPCIPICASSEEVRS